MMPWPPEDPDTWAVEARFKGGTPQPQSATIAGVDEVDAAQIESLLSRIKVTRDYVRSLEASVALTNGAISTQYENLATMKRLLLHYGWKGTSC